MVGWFLAQVGPGRTPGAGRGPEDPVSFGLTDDPVHWIAIVLALFLLGLWFDRNNIHLTRGRKKWEDDGD